MGFDVTQRNQRGAARGGEGRRGSLTQLSFQVYRDATTQSGEISKLEKCQNVAK